VGWTTGESWFDCLQELEILSTAARPDCFGCQPNRRPDGSGACCQGSGGRILEL